MNLVEAFREIAPVEGTNAAQHRRREAAALIYEELRSLAAGTWRGMDENDRNDVASEVLIRMMNNGPRGHRDGDPATDRAVRAYLRESIRNGLRDLLRRRRRLDMPGELDPVDTGPGTAELAVEREGQKRLNRLREEIFNGLVPRIAAETKGGLKGHPPITVEVIASERTAAV